MYISIVLPSLLSILGPLLLIPSWRLRIHGLTEEADVLRDLMDDIANGLINKSPDWIFAEQIRNLQWRIEITDIKKMT